jgi:PAS domain S-box-containing protein
MIEHSSDITAVFDAERRVRYLSPSAQRVLGWESDVVGRSGLEFVHPDDQTMLAERIRAPEAPAAPFVLRVRTRGGRWLRLEAVSRRVPDEQGREIVIVNARDVSEREHLETSLREAQKLESVGRLAGRLVPASITLRVEAAQDALHALIDPTQLEQVVLKLVVNARDAIGESGAGEGHVTLAVRERALAEDEEAGMAPGRCIAITVQDTGIGIPDAVRPHVFEPFFTTKAQGDGTGLALATSYGIVRQAGGCLRFDSTVGAGTTFEVLLPRAEGEPEAVESAPTTPAPARGEVVLVAEDDAAVRALEVRATHRSACSSCPATPATPTSSARCRSVRASCRSRSRPTSWCGWCRRWRGRGVRAQANTLQIERPRFDVRTAPTLVAHVRPKASHNARHVQR